MNPNIRTVTDLTTIPASVVQVGTLTPFAGDVLLLEYSGTAAALDAILVQAGANKDQQKTALWVWDGTSTAPFNVTAWFGKFIKVDRDASAYTGDFNLIETKLFGWEVISTGDGTGTVSGSAIGALNTISFKPITDFFVDPVVVEGNVSDNLTVLEFYNQQSGSGNGSGSGLENYIEVDKAGFLALVAANALTFPALYKITDIENGFYLEALSANSYNPQGVLSLLIPDYTVAPQLVMGEAVTIGDLYSWGGQIWENTSGNNPDYVTQLELEATDWDLVPKSLANDYVAIQLNAVYDFINDIFVFASQDGTQNEYSLSQVLASFQGGDAIYSNTWQTNINTAQGLTQNNSLSGFIINTKVKVIENKGAGNIANNFGDSDSKIQLNDVQSGGGVTSNSLLNSSIYELNVIKNGAGSSGVIKNFSVHSEITENETDGEDCNIWFNFQHHASSIRRNVLRGTNTFIQAFQQNNNSECNDNTLIGDGIACTGFSQLFMDKFNGNSFVGNSNRFSAITQNGQSEISGFDVQANNCQFTNIEQTKAILKNFTYTATKNIIGLQMSNCTIENGNNISITNCSFDHSLNLTGFAVDIEGETIHSGKGWFAITRDFDTTPLTDGIPELHNIIPVGGYITSIKAKGSITSGTSLTIGLESDDASLISQVVANYAAGQTYNGISAVATANRSLRLVSVGDLNAGSVTILVEFMV